MTMWFQLTDKTTGEKQIVATLGGIDESLFDVVEVGRELGEFEDFTDGKVVENERRKADAEAGPEHVAEARQMKYLEALMVKAGVQLTSGLLVQEANLQNRDIADLADDVLVKRKGFEDVELARQTAQLEEKVS